MTDANVTGVLCGATTWPEGTNSKKDSDTSVVLSRADASSADGAKTSMSGIE
jgi:hypothetical protein